MIFASSGASGLLCGNVLIIIGRSPFPDVIAKAKAITLPAYRMTDRLVCSRPTISPSGPWRSDPLAPSRSAKRIQPAHNISDSDSPHLRVLSILSQHFVAFDHRDQKARSLLRIQVAADYSLRLPPAQRYGNSLLPATKYPLQSPSELFIELRHLLRQIDERTSAVYVSRPSR